MDVSTFHIFIIAEKPCNCTCRLKLFLCARDIKSLSYVLCVVCVIKWNCNCDLIQLCLCFHSFRQSLSQRFLLFCVSWDRLSCFENNAPVRCAYEYEMPLSCIIIHISLVGSEQRRRASAYASFDIGQALWRVPHIGIVVASSSTSAKEWMRSFDFVQKNKLIFCPFFCRSWIAGFWLHAVFHLLRIIVSHRPKDTRFYSPETHNYIKLQVVSVRLDSCVLSAAWCFEPFE